MSNAITLTRRSLGAPRGALATAMLCWTAEAAALHF
jgi:hypothetical protein